MKLYSQYLITDIDHPTKDIWNSDFMTHVQMCSTVCYSTRLLRAPSSPFKTLLSSGTRLSADVPSCSSTEVFFSVSHHSVKLFCLFLAENQIMEWADENQWKLEGTFRDPLTKAHTFMCLGIVFHHLLLFKASQLQNVLQKEFLHIKQSSFDCKNKEEKTFTANMCISTSTDCTYGHINIPSILLYGLLYLIIVFVNVSAVAQIKQEIMDDLCADNGKKYVEIIIRYNQSLRTLFMHNMPLKRSMTENKTWM